MQGEAGFADPIPEPNPLRPAFLSARKKGRTKAGLPFCLNEIGEQKRTFPPDLYGPSSASSH